MALSSDKGIYRGNVSIHSSNYKAGADFLKRGYLNKALDIYTAQPTIFKNEIARTKYKLGCVLQDMGDNEKGIELIKVAEQLRQEIVPPEKWEPAKGEEDFDEIVQFWTR